MNISDHATRPVSRLLAPHARAMRLSDRKISLIARLLLLGLILVACSNAQGVPPTQTAAPTLPTASAVPSDTPTLPAKTPTRPVEATYTASPVPPTPTRTLVPTRAPTLRPTPIPEGQRTLYETKFEDGDSSLSKWKTFGYFFDSRKLVTQGYTGAASAGFYRINTTGTNQRVFAIYDVDLGTDDVDVTILTTPPDSVIPRMQQTGLVCRYTDAGWYQFVMEPNDQWAIRKAAYDDSGQLRFYSLSTGTYYFSREQKVTLRAECKGNRLTLWASDLKLASLLDNTYPAGKVGLLGWGYDTPGEVAAIDTFKVQRAQWMESSLSGPAPTPASDTLIYATKFENVNVFNQHFFAYDTQWGGIMGSYSQTMLYINDFDPGIADIEISADFRNNSMDRSLICRYSQDGFYEVRYWVVPMIGNHVSLSKHQRSADGTFQTVGLGGKVMEPLVNRKLALKCAGSQISVSVNDQQVINVKDGTWANGRYGFILRADPPFNPQIAFLNYRVDKVSNSGAATTAAVNPGGVVFADEFDNASATLWRWNDTMKHLFTAQIKGGALHILPLTFSGGSAQLEVDNLSQVEIEMDVEFVSKNAMEFVVRCASLYDFRIDNIHQSWYIRKQPDGKTIAKGTSLAIAADRDHVSVRCDGSRVAFSVNGVLLAAEVIEPFDLSQRSTIEVMARPIKEGGGHELEIDHFRLKLLADPPAIPAQKGDVPFYIEAKPGAELYKADFSRTIDWRELKSALPTWQFITHYGGGQDRESMQGRLILDDSNNGILLFGLFRTDFSDFPIEINADVAFTGKSREVMLICRENPTGYYAFSLYPNGQWFIQRRDADARGSSRPKNASVLAKGQSPAIVRGKNQVSAVCQDDELVLRVNGEELGRVKDSLFVDGKVGLGVGEYSEGEFFNFSVRRLK